MSSAPEGTGKASSESFQDFANYVFNRENASSIMKVTEEERELLLKLYRLRRSLLCDRLQVELVECMKSMVSRDCSTVSVLHRSCLADAEKGNMDYKKYRSLASEQEQ